MPSIRRLKYTLLPLVLSCGIALPSVSYAAENLGMYGNDLARCLTASLSDQDKKIMQTFFISTLLAHPDFKHKNPYFAAEIKQNQRQIGALFTRLFAKDCTKEFALSSYYDSEEIVGNAIELAAAYSLTELIKHPVTQRHARGVEKYINEEQIEHGMRKVLGVDK